MTAPFAPVAFPVFRTRRTPHPASSSSSNPGSSPSDGVPWVKGPVGPLVPPSRSQPCPGPDRLSGSREGAEGSWFLQDGVPKDCWLERPITPTLLGYEIMEERAKFTVYKVLVTGSKGDSWVIFRRYADFSRLNEKLKEIFPRFHLGLPPKRWFKDNYDMEFLEERQIGLQSFLQNLIGHKDIVSSEVVRQFLCLDDPRSPFDSLEESRAFCETLEETNHRLQRALLEKQKEIDHLKRLLQERGDRIRVLEKRSNLESPGPLCPSHAGSGGNLFTEQNADMRRAPDAGAQGEEAMDTNAEGQRRREEEEGAGGGFSAVEAKEESSLTRSGGPASKSAAYWSTLAPTGSPVAPNSEGIGKRETNQN